MKKLFATLMVRLFGKTNPDTDASVTKETEERRCINCLWGQDTAFCKCPLGNCIDQDDCDHSQKWKHK